MKKLLPKSSLPHLKLRGGLGWGYDWQSTFSTIRRIIKDFPIPYVTRLSRRYESDPDKRAFAVLISTIISLRTKDKVTEEASERLLAIADTSEKMLKIDEAEIAKMIYPCGFYRTKAGQIFRIAEILTHEYKNSVPKTLDKLIKLPGVGRKTANLVLTEGFDVHGICVDTHVHRILNRLGAIKTKTPDDTELILRQILPKIYWKKINLWLVMFGQYHCKPVGPKCGECDLRKRCAYFIESTK